MKLDIMGKEVELKKEEVSACKKMVTKFFEQIRALSARRIAPTFYWTAVIVTHVITTEMLNTIDSDFLEKLLNSSDKKARREIIEERKQQKIQTSKKPRE